MKNRILLALVATIFLGGGSASAGLGDWFYGESWKFMEAVGGIGTGVMGFKGLRKEFNWKKSILFYIWVPFLLYCLGGPKVRELLLTDKCLDSGGRWDKSHFECKYK